MNRPLLVAAVVTALAVAAWWARERWWSGADVAGAIATIAATTGLPYGLTVVTDADPHTPLDEFARDRAAGGEPMPERVVVLIHGLDDPGWMWRDVIPALRARGHVVLRMEYPNDGPIAEAADLLAGSLHELRAAGVVRIDVVAHSMGGLVTRDVLTRDAYYGGDGSGGGSIEGDPLPAVERFVMCGTPNHGSAMARLRAVAEVKEQLTRTFSGEGTWLGGLSDGAGEAAGDLLPGSAFLNDLNARAPAEGVQRTIIAGRMSPLTGDEVAALGRSARRAADASKAPAWLRKWIDKADDGASQILGEIVRGLGDGCVTLDSARLDGVDDYRVVESNHVSMIVRMLPIDPDPPPAIPIILDRLGVVDPLRIENVVREPHPPPDSD